MYVHRHWVPVAISGTDGLLRLCKHGDIIHTFSDTFRQYCESLWYSGLEYKRPTHEEIVIHSIRTIMNWLDAAEDHATRILSIYDLITRIDYFEETLTDYVKALKLCGYVLDRLGSIYHRVCPLPQGQNFIGRALVDYESKKIHCRLNSNHFYQVVNNLDPHIWHLNKKGYVVPSIFLDVSTREGEKKMLKKLQRRFEDFLIMCHCRVRRQLFSRITKMLHTTQRYSTLPAMRHCHENMNDSNALNDTPKNGFYFPRSPYPNKRWRSTHNPHNITNQPKCIDYETHEETLLPHTVRILLTRLRNWLHQLPSAGLIMNGSLKPKRLSVMMKISSQYYVPGSNIVTELQKWWNFTHETASNRDQLEKVVREAIFIKKLNEIMQIKVNIEKEKLNVQHISLDDQTSSSSSSAGLFKNHKKLTPCLVEQLLSRLGTPFYHPRSGHYSYRTFQRSTDSSKTYSIPGTDKLLTQVYNVEK